MRLFGLNFEKLFVVSRTLLRVSFFSSLSCAIWIILSLWISLQVSERHASCSDFQRTTSIPHSSPRSVSEQVKFQGQADREVSQRAMEYFFLSLPRGLGLKRHRLASSKLFCEIQRGRKSSAQCTARCDSLDSRTRLHEKSKKAN
jgi:hypothetical protein